MYRGRLGTISKSGHWRYKEFAMANVTDVYTLAELYRRQNNSMSVSIKFEEVDADDPANKA